MDSLNLYRGALEAAIHEYARDPFSVGKIELQPVFDRQNDHYILMATGWIDKRRIHAPLIHADIIEGKIWIQHDGTEEGIATDLLAAGVPKDRIVLAFQHPSRRKYSEFAVE